MKSKAISMIAIALLGLFLLSADVSRVYAEAGQITSLCTNATFTGSYGFYRAGSTPDGTLAAVGILFFDGNGNFKVRQSISKGGVYNFGVTGSGQYKVNGDCTYKGFYNGAEFTKGVIVDGGKTIYGLSESPGNAVYLVGTKINP